MTKAKAVKRIAILGIIGNILLLIIKLWAGLTTRSQAMIADGMNSAGDVFASVMTYLGNHIASQPDDQDHPYGHGKAEYLFSMLISLSLIVISIIVFKQSLDSLVSGQSYLFSSALVYVSAITILTKLILYRIAAVIGKRYNSLLAFANAEDHRNDVFLTSLTLFSILTSQRGFHFIDGIAGMLIALWIAYSGISIFATSYNVLMDTTLAQDILRQMRQDVRDVNGVDHLDALVSKPVGLNYLLIVKASVKGDLSIAEGHDISEVIRYKLLTYDLVDDVVVHLNQTEKHPEKDLLK